MADIELTQDWTPIGTATNPFTGTLDGRGHTIDLNDQVTTAQDGSDYYAGLFGYVGSSGNVKNLRLEGTMTFGDFAGFRYVGAVAGHNGGTIENIVSRVELMMDITSTASGYGGGIAGTNAGTIKNCASVGNIFLSRIFQTGAAGGIAGSNSGTIEYCWASGTINGSTGTGGIVGSILSVSTTVKNCVALNDTVNTFYSTLDMVGRVVGSDQYNSSLSGNYATSEMDLSYGYTSPTLVSPPYNPAAAANNKHGADANDYETQSWWENNIWSAVWGIQEVSPWQWDATAKRPRLWFDS
jgi:hypothetical protein